MREPKYRPDLGGGWWWLSPHRPVHEAPAEGDRVTDEEFCALFAAMPEQRWPQMQQPGHWPRWHGGAYGAASIGYESREAALAALAAAAEIPAAT